MTYEVFKDTKISSLSLGTVQFGFEYGIANKTGRPTQDIVKEILDFVKKNGLNTLDTAKAYKESEKVLGTYGVSEFNIVSKLSSKELDIQNLNTSLENLKIDKLFALLLHDTQLLYNWDSSLIKSIKEKTTFFGVSIYSENDFELAIANNDIDIIQIPYNLFDQRALCNNWFEKAKKQDKFLFIRSVYLQGLLLLSQKELKLPSAIPFVKKLEEISQKYNIEKKALAFDFVKMTAQNASILFGCETLKQAKENLEIFNNKNSITQECFDEIVDCFVNIPEDIYNPSKWLK